MDKIEALEALRDFMGDYVDIIENDEDWEKLEAVQGYLESIQAIPYPTTWIGEKWEDYKDMSIEDIIQAEFLSETTHMSQTPSEMDIKATAVIKALEDAGIKDKQRLLQYLEEFQDGGYKSIVAILEGYYLYAEVEFTDGLEITI